MRNTLRNILALVSGLLLGGAANLAIITLGPALIAPPPGIDPSSAEGLRAGMHLLQPRHFLMPFLAHALGTWLGALTAALMAVSHRLPIAFGVGAAFLCGGIAASFMIPAPAWFIVLDLVLAYLPMAWLGHRSARSLQGRLRSAASAAA